MFAVDDDSVPYALSDGARTRKALRWQFMVHHVRSIFDAVPSVIREDENAPPSFEYRRKHILEADGPDLSAIANPIARAISSIVWWSKIIKA